MGWQPRDGIAARDKLVGRLGGGEQGLRFAVPDDPSMIRGADGVYIPPEQLAQVRWDGRAYFTAVPALVIEVISETDLAADVDEKVQDYLAGGARSVWCVYPYQHAIHIHRADSATRVMRGEEPLTDEDVLPGLSVPLNMIFADE